MAAAAAAMTAAAAATVKSSMALNPQPATVASRDLAIRFPKISLGGGGGGGGGSVRSGKSWAEIAADDDYARNETGDVIDDESDVGSVGSAATNDSVRCKRRAPFVILKPEPVAVPEYLDKDTDTPGEYLRKTIQHVAAEYWAFFQKAVEDLHPGWRYRRSHVYKINVSRPAEVSDAPNAAASKEGVELPTGKDSYDLDVECAHDSRRQFAEVFSLVDLKGHLVIYRDNLFFTHSMVLKCGCRPQALFSYQCETHPNEKSVLRMRKLMSMLEYPDEEAATDNDRETQLFDLGYCEDLVKARSALTAIAKAAANPRQTTDRFAMRANLNVLNNLCDPAAALAKRVPFRPRKPTAESLPMASAATAAISGQAVLKQKGKGAAASAVAEAAAVAAETAAADKAAREADEFNESPMRNDVGDTLLCEAQLEVVEGLNRPLELIHGPPGTGKSTCIRYILRHRLPFFLDDVTLVVAVQNKAVDVLVSMLLPFVDNDFATSKVKMFVVGSSRNSNLGRTAACFTFESLINANVEYAEKLSAFESLRDTSSTAKNLQRQLLAQELTDMRVAIGETIFGGAKIVFSTVTEIHKILTNRRISAAFLNRIKSVVVDEAGTMPEWQAAMLAGLPEVKRVLAIGDPKQLPPFTAVKNIKIPLGFLERAQKQLEHRKLEMPMLTMQFRMHKDIASLVSNAFYEGKLTTDPITSRARQPIFMPGCLRVSGLYWLDYRNELPTHKLVKVGGTMYEVCPMSSAEQGVAVAQGCAEFEGRVYDSYANPTELMHLLNGLELFANYGILDSSRAHLCKTVSVITFYKQQVDLLKVAIEKSKFAPLLVPAMATGGLRIQTVDSSQGSEADIVLLSGVRSNPQGAVGFLGTSSNGPKRLCVSLSRAKEALVIIGDQATLAGSKGPRVFQNMWPEGPNTLPVGSPMKCIDSFSRLYDGAAAAAARRADDALFIDFFEGYAGSVNDGSYKLKGKCGGDGDGSGRGSEFVNLTGGNGGKGKGVKGERQPTSSDAEDEAQIQMGSPTAPPVQISPWRAAAEEDFM